MSRPSATLPVRRRPSPWQTQRPTPAQALMPGPLSHLLEQMTPPTDRPARTRGRKKTRSEPLRRSRGLEAAIPDSHLPPACRRGGLQRPPSRCAEADAPAGLWGCRDKGTDAWATSGSDARALGTSALRTPHPWQTSDRPRTGAIARVTAPILALRPGSIATGSHPRPSAYPKSPMIPGLAVSSLAVSSLAVSGLAFAGRVVPGLVVVCLAVAGLVAVRR